MSPSGQCRPRSCDRRLASFGDEVVRTPDVEARVMLYPLSAVFEIITFSFPALARGSMIPPGDQVREGRFRAVIPDLLAALALRPCAFAGYNAMSAAARGSDWGAHSYVSATPKSTASFPADAEKRARRTRAEFAPKIEIPVAASGVFFRRISANV